MEENSASVIRKVPERARAKKPTPPRRGYSLDKKLQVVRETLTPGASVSVVARRHDINSNVVFRWRRMYMRGELEKTCPRQNKKPAPQSFVPVGVVERAGILALPAPERETVAVHAPAATELGVIEIETALGTKLRLTGNVDERILRLVLAEIRRRR